MMGADCRKSRSEGGPGGLRDQRIYACSTYLEPDPLSSPGLPRGFAPERNLPSRIEKSDDDR
jgi:hypothetical protein